MEWFLELRALCRNRMLDAVQQRVKLSCSAARRNVNAHRIIERQKTHGVTLMVGKVGKARREHLCVIALLHFAGSIVHGATHIENDQNTRIRFALEELDEEFVAAAEDVPVDATDFVAGLILPVFCEIDAEPKIRRLMQSRHEALDDSSRHELHVLNANQNLG